MAITREEFDQQRSPRFGSSNPERMTYEFWEWMIRGDHEPGPSAPGSIEKCGLSLRDSKLKSSYGPYRARDFFNVPLNREDGPIWTFDRMGQTKTVLPDGKVVCIGGEHEDFYDPDFYIYNDVVVLTPDDRIEIYGYPKEVFPPTDFHSATLFDSDIVVIGGVGYKTERRFGFTPVYALDLSNYQFSEIATSGEMPGWISKHSASSAEEGVIIIRGGQVFKERQSKQRICRNLEDYALDLRQRVWRRITDRNWREFQIRQEKGAFVLDRRPRLETLLPSSAQPHNLPSDGRSDLRFLVGDVVVSVSIQVTHIELVVEGAIPSALLDHVLEELRSSVEIEVRQRCTLREV